jgi:hypothetical protein
MIVASPAEGIIWGLCEMAGLRIHRTSPPQLIREGWPPHWWPGWQCYPDPASLHRLFIAINMGTWDELDRQHYAAWREGRIAGTLLVIGQDGLTRILLSLGTGEPLGELLRSMAVAQEG